MIDRNHLASLHAKEQAEFLSRNPKSKAAYEAADNLFGRVPMTWMNKKAGGFPIYFDRAHEANGPAVGVCGGERETPLGHTKAFGKVFGYPLGVFGGKHRGDATEFSDAALHGLDGCCRGVSGHRSGVTECEVDVLIPIDVRDPVPLRGGEVDRVPTGPLVHPGHRHSPEEVIC